MHVYVYYSRVMFRMMQLSTILLVIIYYFERQIEIKIMSVKAMYTDLIS